jgi:hypothetical protein
VAQVVEHLPSKCEVLSSTRNKKRSNSNIHVYITLKQNLIVADHHRNKEYNLNLLDQQKKKKKGKKKKLKSLPEHGKRRKYAKIHVDKQSRK